MTTTDDAWEAFGRAVDARHWKTEPAVPVRTLRNDQAEPQAVPLKLLVRTPSEIAAMTPDKPEFLAPYIVKGSLTELTGYAKKGKTSFLAYEVGCIVHGVYCLEQPTRETGVLWLTEERLPTFRATLNRAGLLSAPRLHVCSRWDIPPSTTWPKIVEEASALCRSLACGLLVVDTLPAWAGLTGDKENNAGDALEALEPLQRAAAAGLAVVIVRHDRKGGGLVGESGRGSSAFAGAVDTLLALKLPEGQGHPSQRVLTAISRYDNVPDSLVVERADSNTYSSQPMGSGFNKHFYRPLGAPGPLGAHAVAQAIVETASDWMTPKQLVMALPTFGKGTVENLLRSMHPERLDRMGTGRKNSAYAYRRRAEVDLSYSTSIPREKENKQFPEAPAHGIF